MGNAEGDHRGNGSSVTRIIWRTPFLRAACISLFVAGIAASSTMPQMTLYLVTELHIPIQAAGLYYLVNLTAPVAGFVVGTLSERLTNRLSLYRACAVVAALGWAAMALADRPWMPFLIGAFVLSFGGGAMGQLFAATRDELSRHPTPADNRIVSAVRMSFTAGWIVGPVLGSWFGATFGLRSLLLANAACLVAQLVPLGTRRIERFKVEPVRPEVSAGPTDGPHGDRTDGPTTYGTKNTLTPLLVFLGCCVLVMNGDTMKFAFLPLYMANQLHVGDALRGTVIAVQPFLELLLMPVFARMADRFTPIRVLTMAALLGVGAHVAYATSTHVVGLFVGQALMSGVWAAVAGLGITVAQQLCPDRIGLASSMFSSCIPLAGAVGGSVGAFGVGWLGIPHLFVIPAVLTVLGFAGFLLTSRRFKPDDSAFAVGAEAAKA
ncbi:MFS transporter [Actinopolymorpha sp. NPDC004070]|uniref:MFS transporter n=1 Tax=Actinopolymorpha sp. NPDC004070 TaxID=3154548 RepID=UPI0033B8444E